MPTGRAAVVLDTGAASRGSGNANTNKEKDVRQWFVEQDLIEGVIYLPENLFYNTTAPGHHALPEQGQAKGPQGQGLPAQRQPANSPRATRRTISPTTRIQRIADTFKAWQEEEKFSRIVDARRDGEERFQHLAQPLHPHRRSREYRPIAEIVEELEGMEAEAEDNQRCS